MRILRSAAFIPLAGLLAATGDGADIAPGNEVDTYFGVRVADPYRVLEKLDTPPASAWLATHAKRAAGHLQALPQRAALLGEIEALRRDESRAIGALRQAGNGRIFYRLTAPGAPAKLMESASIDAEPRVVVDESRLHGPDGEAWAIKFFQPSPDGRQVLVGLNRASDDGAKRIIVVEAATGRTVDTLVRDVWATWELTPSWHPDGRSFYYQWVRSGPTAAPPPLIVYRHKLGEAADRDQPVFGAGLAPNLPLGPAASPQVIIPAGSAHAFAVVFSTSPEAGVFVAPVDRITGAATPWQRVAELRHGVPGFGSFVVRGRDLYILANRDGRGRMLLRTPVDRPDLDRAEIVVAADGPPIFAIAQTRNSLYLLSNTTSSRLLRLDPSMGRISEVELPFPASLWNFLEGNAPDQTKLIVSLTGWTRPAGLYVLPDGAKTPAPTGLLPPGRSALADIAVEEHFATSHDGVRIPLTVLRPERQASRGPQPTILFAYGAYGTTYWPAYEPEKRAWFDRGGIWAQCGVRGGGEGGAPWHEAGRLERKVNSWKDYIACAERLIELGYASPKTLAADGFSMGGIVIGRAITERPELFAVAYDGVPVSDAVRHDSPSNNREIGDPATEAGFRSRLAMSAYHHVRDGTAYPPVLLTAGGRDRRVPAWQAAKMAARLMAATSRNAPILLRYDPDAGHFDGSAELLADKWAFFLSEIEAGRRGGQPVR